MRVLVVNAGSSSLKLTLLDGADATIAARELEAPRSEVDVTELRAALDSPLGEADAVGHRIVHGGERFREAVRIDADIETAMRELTDLAPLHQPKSLAALDAVTEALGGLPAVACFDTAFHTTLPQAAATYALPAEWRERWGLRRYGFHGLSHAWVARRTPELLGKDPAGLRIVSCHLGAGASLCAIQDGRLKGLAGTADMREVLWRADAGDEPARLALDVYVHRLRAGIAAMAAALGGIDALVFTGGVGEHSSEVRAQAAAGLAFLGVAVDGARNDETHADGDIGAHGAAVRTLVLTAREDLEIARQVRAVLGLA